jgi:hypothetical protein
MAERRTAERLIVHPDSLQRVTPPDGFRIVTDPAAEPEEQTQPLRLSFLALLAERDPAVQARLELRRNLALEEEDADLEDEDRPTDPFIPARRD